MTRTLFGSLLAAFALSALAGCASSCKENDGSVDGYCRGTVAANCRTTCADCNDEWVMQACPAACTVVETKPGEGALTGQDPNQGDPAKWAVCTTN